MPFKLRLKKSRHYSVVSKSLFIISVEALDGCTVECTLSTESTGLDCLQCACQKLSLNQPEFFGLQFLCRSGTEANSYCWLDLDRPVKKQLDKYAARMTLHMRVMFYVVSGVRLITDEIARYHYFLQLKLDVIEGRIICSPKQAVQLAGYCMQAELGNYDAEKHTLDYLKDFQFFPKSFSESGLLDSLTSSAIHQHAELNNLPQGTAEEYFIQACQHLEGYGVEHFQAQDHSNNNIILGVSLTGISVVSLDGRSSKFYGWTDVANVVNHKRYLTLECIVPQDSVQFHFSSVETAKRAFCTSVLQNRFFRKYEMLGEQQSGAAFHQTANEDKAKHLESNEDLSADTVDHMWDSSLSQLSQRAQSTSCLDINTPTDIDKLRMLLPSYRPAPDYETAMQQKYRNSSGAVPGREPVRTSQPTVYSSQPEIHRTESYARLLYPDVTHNNIGHAFVQPVYNAVYSPQIRTGSDNSQNTLDLAENMRLLHLSRPPPPYPTNRLNSNSTPDLAVTSQNVKFQPHFVSNQVSGSSPDLVSTGTFLKHHYLKQYGQLLYQPQPVHRSHSYLPPNTHGTYENLTSFFDNNMSQAVIVQNSNLAKHIQKVYDEHGNIIYCLPTNVKQYLQEGPTNQYNHGGNFMISANRELNRDKLKNSNEPIYENIPFPWQNSEENQMRSRTQSIQSAPEISRIVDEAAINTVLAAKVAYSSKENLYANIGSDLSLNNKKEDWPKTGMNDSQLNSSVNNLTDNSSVINRSIKEADAMLSVFNTSSNIKINESQNSGSLNRNNTYVLRPESSNTSSSVNSSSNSKQTNVSSGSDNSITKTKKKRWGILMGRNKSGDKVKSATLGREKSKESKQPTNERHRWSTGLPRLQPLPPSISKETMCQILEQKLSDSQLFFEFEKIPRKKPNADFTSALHPENAVFNRFKEVLPYEDNRVRLTPTPDNKFGYINASHITATVGSKQRFYIAAQGPTTNTLPTFWHCVWETEVYLLVQLTDASENVNYLPDSGDRCVDSGQYQVWWEFSQRTGHCVTSKVRLCHVQSRRYRTIWHLHYAEWGDQGSPISVAHYLGFLEELRSVREHSLNEIPPEHNRNPPVLVHCTAGVGRTGLTILSDLLLYMLDHNQELDVPRVVAMLRYQRTCMVKTIAQYRFVYLLLIYYLRQTRLI